MSDTDREQEQQAPGYEPPRAEDVSTEDAPSVTAAGGTKTIGAG